MDSHWKISQPFNNNYKEYVFIEEDRQISRYSTFLGKELEVTCKLRDQTNAEMYSYLFWKCWRVTRIKAHTVDSESACDYGLSSAQKNWWYKESSGPRCSSVQGAHPAPLGSLGQGGSGKPIMHTNYKLGPSDKSKETTKDSQTTAHQCIKTTFLPDLKSYGPTLRDHKQNQD